MNGWLVVNGFLKSAKFEDIYGRLLRAWERRGVSITVRTNAELLAAIGEPISPPPDFVLFWDKDFLLAEHLENQALHLFNSARGIRLCDDKAETALAIEKAVCDGKISIRMPKTIFAPGTFHNVGYPKTDFLEKVADLLGFPLIAKERQGSFGQQVFWIRNLAELKARLEESFPRRLIFQEFIASSFGRDMRIQTVGSSVVASVLRQGAPGDFRSNVTAGGTMTAQTPPASFEKAALDAARALGLDFAGIDLLFGPDGEPILCEVNSNPHFKNLWDATGVDVAELLADYIEKKIADEKR